MLNKVWVGIIDNDEEKSLKAKFTNNSEETYPKDALHMFAKNEPAMKKNKDVLNKLPGYLFTIE